MQVPEAIALLAFVHSTLGSIFPVPNELNNVVAVATTIGSNATVGNNATTGHNATTRKRPIVARRAGRAKPRRSTSSSSGEKVVGVDKSLGDSLGIQTSGSSDELDKQHRLEGGGWRKWHRKCTPCPADMAKKWRDPTIKWICAGYQRARRSFKSECMMYYRNCQDGTMFQKLSDHRCDHTAVGYRGGRHFFYDYNVKMPDDTSGKTSESALTEDNSSDDDINYGIKTESMSITE